jgi:hypothetical protein
MPSVRDDAAPPLVETKLLLNGEVGSGSDPSGYGNSPPPMGIDGSRENRPRDISIARAAAGVANCASCARID